MITEEKNLSMRTIGIVGGMGPFAGIELMREIFEQTKASRDQEHLPVIQISMPERIVDRTAFLTGQTDVNPALVIGELIDKLEKAGAERLPFSCQASFASSCASSDSGGSTTAGWRPSRSISPRL